MLGDDELCLTSPVEPCLVLHYLVVFGSMDETHNVGILLYGTRLAEVAQLWSLALLSLPRLYATVQLAECNDGYVEFLGESL